MSADWVQVVAGAAGFLQEIIMLVMLDRKPNSSPKPEIHPALRPGASSTLSRLGFGMGGRL